MLAPLEGFVVAVTADRRAAEQADLLERRGARVVHGAMVRNLPLGTDALRTVTEEVIERPPGFVLANTGIGVRGWLTAAASWGLDDALAARLASSRVFARGAKAAGALAAIGVEVAWRAPGESLQELLAHTLQEPIDGATVVFQQHGTESPELVAALRAAGAHVLEVPVYRLTGPVVEDGAAAMVSQVCNGDVDAVTFTSAPAVEGFFATARDLGMEPEARGALRRRVVTAVVGPYCADAARDQGLDALVEPVAPRMGSMVRAVTERLAGARTVLRGEAHTVTVQGRAVDVAADRTTPTSHSPVVWLPTRERWLLDRLVQRPGAVVSRGELCRAVWGTPVDGHALDVTVARLRRRLGSAAGMIETLPKRGYRVAPDLHT